MSRSVAKELENARKQISVDGAELAKRRQAEIDKALGGNGGQGGAGGPMFGGVAPAFVKTAAQHIAASPMMFGRKSIPELMGIGEIPAEGKAGPGVFLSVNFRDQKANKFISPELKEMLLDIKKQIHNCFIQQQIMAHKSKMPVAVTDTPYFKTVVEPILKAFSLADFATWVPTLNTSFYFEEFELAPMFEQYFPEYTMPSKTSNVPGATVRMVGKLQLDTDTFVPQYNTASNYTMTAQDCVVHTDITEDLMSDMVPNAGGFDRLRKEVSLGVQRAKERALLEGDDTDSGGGQGSGHMDSDVQGIANDFRKAFKGLRKKALAAGYTYDNGGQPISLNTYNGLLSVMGKFAIDKADLVIAIGPTAANKAVFGNVPEMLTQHNVGNLATLVTGKVPPMYGIEQYPSEWIREDLGASGVYTGVAPHNTYIIAAKKSRFVIGQRAPVRIWATPSLASSDKMLLSAKERFTFGSVPQTGNEVSVACAIGVGLN